MLNLNASVNDVGPSPGTSTEMNSLEFEKPTDAVKSSSPFQQLMAQLAAQAEAMVARDPSQSTAGLTVAGLADEGLRQEDATPADSQQLTSGPAEATTDALQAFLSPSPFFGVGPTPCVGPQKWTPVEFMPQQVTGSDAKEHIHPAGMALALKPSPSPGVLGFHAPNTVARVASLEPTPQSPQLPSAWGDWRETRVSQGLTVITRPMDGMDDGNLSDFALQQGLDANTVRWLLMQPSSSSAKVAVEAGVSHSNAPSLPTGHALGPSNLAIELDLSPGLETQWSQWLKLNHDANFNRDGNPIDKISAAPWDGALEGPALDDAPMGGQNPGDSGHAGLNGQGPHAFQKALTEHTTHRQSLPLNTPMSGQDLADKMNQAIGKRLLEAIEKGDWQLKINLKPAELGHIEVDLRMRDNALEAKFTASQMIARDLLESGLGRLKDTLQQSGMDVASIRVNDGSNARNGGDSTPRQAPQGQQVQGQVRDDSNRMDETPTPRNDPISDGRLDLMV
jgi:hypothetical protein